MRSCKVNPDPARLKTMHDKDAERMRNFTDVPDADVRSIRTPTLIVIGDRDIVKLEHAMELSQFIPDARLLVLPGGHGDYMGEATSTQSATRAPELTAGLDRGVSRRAVTASDPGTASRPCARNGRPHSSSSRRYRSRW